MTIEKRHSSKPTQETQQPHSNISTEPDAAFKFSIEQAEDSGVLMEIARAKNKYAHWLSSQEQRRYDDAASLFRQIARIQESQTDTIEAAITNHNLSKCLLLIGSIDSLKEANQTIKKAIELYPDLESFTQLRKTAVIMQINILWNLADRTERLDYFCQGQRILQQHPGLITDKDKEVRKELESTEQVLGKKLGVSLPDMGLGREELASALP